MPIKLLTLTLQSMTPTTAPIGSSVLNLLFQYENDEAGRAPTGNRKLPLAEAVRRFYGGEPGNMGQLEDIIRAESVGGDNEKQRLVLMAQKKPRIMNTGFF